MRAYYHELDDWLHRCVDPRDLYDYGDPPHPSYLDHWGRRFAGAHNPSRPLPTYQRLHFTGVPWNVQHHPRRESINFTLHGMDGAIFCVADQRDAYWGLLRDGLPQGRAVVFLEAREHRSGAWRRAANRFFVRWSEVLGTLDGQDWEGGTIEPHYRSTKAWRLLSRHVRMEREVRGGPPGTCVRCGAAPPVLNADHIHELGCMGEPYDHSNTQVLCVPCHEWKSEAYVQARRRTAAGRLTRAAAHRLFDFSLQPLIEPPQLPAPARPEEPPPTTPPPTPPPPPGPSTPELPPPALRAACDSIMAVLKGRKALLQLGDIATPAKLPPEQAEEAIGWLSARREHPYVLKLGAYYQYIQPLPTQEEHTNAHP